MANMTIEIDEMDFNRLSMALILAAGVKVNVGNVADANLSLALYNRIGRAVRGDKHTDLPMEPFRKVRRRA